MIDVRCGSTGGSDSVDARCQLYAGHVGAHALLTHDEFGLVLRSWDRTGQPRDEAVDSRTPLPFPWAPGCPHIVQVEVDEGDEVVVA